MKREDDFATRRRPLQDLSDAALEKRFWDGIEQLIDPLLKLGYENTSPAIERSVLLRMGFSSLEAKDIVNGCLEHQLLGHGAGNVVYRMSQAEKCDVRTAGLMLKDEPSWQKAQKLFPGGANA